jgi:hypothetical protein
VDGGIYRDALLGLRARLAELDVRIAEREGQMSPSLTTFLPAELQERLGTLGAARSRTSEGEDSFEGLSRAEEQSVAYLAAMDDALARIPELERELRKLPRTAPRLARRPSHVPLSLAYMVSELVTTVSAVLSRVVTRHDPTARVDALEGIAFAARFQALETPIALLVECFVRSDRPMEPGVRVATSVPRGAARVRVAPDSWGESMMRSLGLSSAIVTRDPDFDGRFLVDGDAGQVSCLLTAPVRSGLLAIAKDDVPELVVEDGSAVLSWSFEPTERSLEAAFSILARVRAADVALRLGK